MATTHLTRRGPARIASHGATTPRVTRLEGDLTLAAPVGCRASAIFKLIGHDGERRIYALWLLVGRDERESVAVSYKFTGEDTIRCDIPIGGSMSIIALEPHLRRFLKTDGFLEGDPPVIKSTQP